MPLITSIAAFIFVLGVLIFVHELGHYFMAKRLGVRVLTFSLGFGPRLAGFRRGDTDYRVSLIPLGGYVKMAGENPDEARSGREDEFLSKSKWQRFQILIMGPTMNVLLAIVLLSVLLMRGAEVPIFESQPPVVGRVIPKSPAEQAGLRPGDLIVSVAGEPVATWDEFFTAIGMRPKRDVPIVVRRGSVELTRIVRPDARTKYEIGEIGVVPDYHPQVRAVTPGKPADRAGIRPGDVILAIDEQPLVRDNQLTDTINKSAGKELTLTISRNGIKQDIRVVPAQEGDIGLIGITIRPWEFRIEKPGPIRAVWMSVERSYDLSVQIFQTLGGLITRETSPKQLIGPLGIAQASGGAAAAGFDRLIELMAVISLNLGLLNLLPIPVLDGGHIFIMALEGLVKREFSVRVKEQMFTVGLVLLMMLMVTVIYNDLMRISWIEDLVPWR